MKDFGANRHPTLTRQKQKFLSESLTIGLRLSEAKRCKTTTKEEKNLLIYFSYENGIWPREWSGIRH